jgi:peptidoglycan/LPS O-acetylase OafA/YrhL
MDGTLQKGRLFQLDGLRGGAAVVVVVFHIMSALTPELVPDQSDAPLWFAYLPIAVLWNGPFAVSVFFVLSGFVVTQAAICRPAAIWVKVAVRYLRLAVPSLASVLFAWLLLTAMPNMAGDLYRLTGSRWLQYTYQHPVPGFSAALFDGAIGIFVTGGSLFNNVLWTMRIELVGSVACIAVAVFRDLRARLVVTSLVAVAALLSKHLAFECFVLGICLREVWAVNGLRSRYAMFALILGLLIGSQGGVAPQLRATGLPWPLMPGNKDGLLYPLGATLVVYASLASPTLSRLLSTRLATFLGEISFPLYLVHVPLIYTVLCAASVHFWPSRLLLVATVAVFLCLCIGIAAAIEHFGEKPFLKLLGRARAIKGPGRRLTRKVLTRRP